MPYPLKKTLASEGLSLASATGRVATFANGLGCIAKAGQRLKDNDLKLVWH